MMPTWIYKPLLRGIWPLLILLAPSISSAAVILGSFELTGDEVVTPTGSSVVGFAEYTLAEDRSKLTLLLKFVGDIDLDGAQTPSLLDDVTGLHVYSGSPGTTGPIVFGILSPSNDTNGNTLLLPAQAQVLSIWDADEGMGTTLTDQMDDLLAGNLYLGLSTAQFPDGEIRGQITVPIPEPTTGSLALLGLVGLLWRRSR